MIKKILLVMIVISTVSFLSISSIMAMHQKSEERVLRTNVVSTVLCPVDGVTMNSEAVYEKVTYKGKEYNVCSQHCLRMFKRSPDTYIK